MERNYGNSSSISVLNEQNYQKLNEDGIVDETSLVREGCSSSSSHSLSNAGSHSFLVKTLETTRKNPSRNKTQEFTLFQLQISIPQSTQGNHENPIQH